MRPLRDGADVPALWVDWLLYPYNQQRRFSPDMSGARLNVSAGEPLLRVPRERGPHLPMLACGVHGQSEPVGTSIVLDQQGIPADV